MGIIDFFVLVLLVVILAALCVYLIGKFAPAPHHSSPTLSGVSPC